MKKEDFIRKITSRKFWMAVAEFVTALLIFLHKDESVAKEVGSLIMLAVTPSPICSPRAGRTPDAPIRSLKLNLPKNNTTPRQRGFIFFAYRFAYHLFNTV